MLRTLTVLHITFTVLHASNFSDYSDENGTIDEQQNNPWESYCESSDYEEFRSCPWFVNVSAVAPRALALPIYGYILPFVVVATVVTNTFIVIILSRDQLKTPTNTILLAMAVSEVLTGLFSSPWFLYYYSFGGYKTDDDVGLPPFWCKSLSVFSEVLPTVTHDGAIWLTVFLAVQRYIYVCVPTIGRRFCTMRNTRIVIIVLSLAPLMCELPKALSTYREVHLTERTLINPITNQTIKQPYRFCIVTFPEWVTTGVGANNFFTTYFFFVVVSVHVLPCLCLALFTGLLIRTIQKADRRRRESLGIVRELSTVTVERRSPYNGVATKPGGLHRRLSLRRYSLANYIPDDVSTSAFGGTPALDVSIMQQVCVLAHQPPPIRPQVLHNSFHATTKMLVTVISVFLTIEIPLAIIFSMYVYVNVVGADDEPEDRLDRLRTVDFINKCLIFRNLLILVSYPFNFAIYCGMSQQFRSTVRQLLTKQSNSLASARTSTSSRLVTPRNGGTSQIYSPVAVDRERLTTALMPTQVKDEDDSLSRDRVLSSSGRTTLQPTLSSASNRSAVAL